MELKVNCGKITLKPMKLGKYYELMRLYRQNKDDVILSQNLIIHSIDSWTLSDEAGNLLPVNIDNLLQNVTLDFLAELDKAVNEVNKLPVPEKNALPATSALS